VIDAARGRAPLSRGRVLVIDDHEQVAAMLRDILGALDYESTSATSPSQGLRLVPVYGPDVILLDIWMPALIGGDVLHLLRREHADIPVIMVVTADQDDDLARELLSRGAFAYVKKPLDIEALERVLQAAMIDRRR
jgi:CheY-like chemotaxis protein